MTGQRARRTTSSVTLPNRRCLSQEWPCVPITIRSQPSRSRISTERSRPVKLSLAKHLLVLSASSPEQGTATEELDSDHVNYEAGPLEIGFQARYLNDITDQIGDNVEFCFADGAAPTVVRDAADQSALYVLMPMRV